MCAPAINASQGLDGENQRLKPVVIACIFSSYSCRALIGHHDSAQTLTFDPRSRLGRPIYRRRVAGLFSEDHDRFQTRSRDVVFRAF